MTSLQLSEIIPAMPLQHEEKDDTHVLVSQPQQFKTYFDLITRVGHSGKYQLRLTIAFMLMRFVGGVLLLSTAFLFRFRTLDCPANGLLVSQEDCRNYVCTLPESEWEKYYALQGNDFQSLATDKQYLCDNGILINIVSSFVYSGAFVGYIVISFLSDNFGRRTAILIAWSVCTLGTLVMAFSFNLWMVAIGMFMCGCGVEAGINICFSFYGQVLGNKKRQKYSVIVMGCFSMGALTSTLFFYLIKEWRVIWISLVVSLTLLEFVLLWTFALETPRFLVQRGVEETLAVLNRIGQINYDTPQLLRRQDILAVAERNKDQKTEGQYITTIDLCRYPSLRVISICGCIIAFMTNALYFGPSLIIDQIGFNIYITNVIVNLSDIVTYLPAFFLVEKIERKSWGIKLYAVCALSALLLTFVTKPQGTDISNEAIVQLVVVFIFRASISYFYCFFQIYLCELYPAKARGIGSGFVSSLGALATAVNPIYLGELQRRDINPMSFFVIFSIIGLSNLTLLQQTKGKPLKEEIDQLQAAKDAEDKKLERSQGKQQEIGGINNASELSDLQRQ